MQPQQNLSMKKVFFPMVCIALLLLLLSGCIQPGTGNEAGQGGNPMNSEKVEAGDSIAVEYKGTLADGTQFDASAGRGPLEFTAGTGRMIKGFDNAVIGMALNEEKTVTLQPSDAYGETDASKIVEIPKENIADANKLAVGMMVTNSLGVNGVVKETKENSVVIDFNHPLAGKALTFWIKVVKIDK
jgi:FKBP-type peptidyl-prolyl cis-trans isomerase 2